jgi:hypothetical protein
LFSMLFCLILCSLFSFSSFRSHNFDQINLVSPFMLSRGLASLSIKSKQKPLVVDIFLQGKKKLQISMRKMK